VLATFSDVMTSVERECTTPSTHRHQQPHTVTSLVSDVCGDGPCTPHGRESWQTRTLSHAPPSRRCMDEAVELATVHRPQRVAVAVGAGSGSSPTISGKGAAGKPGVVLWSKPVVGSPSQQASLPSEDAPATEMDHSTSDFQQMSDPVSPAVVTRRSPSRPVDATGGARSSNASGGGGAGVSSGGAGAGSGGGASRSTAATPGGGGGGGGDSDAEGERVATVNTKNVEFGDNRISTSKYSLISFVPRSLFEQFRRVANIYFLVISILMIIGTYAPELFESPLLPYSTIGPLILVLSITMIKEGIEDVKRHRSDSEINNRLVEVVQPGADASRTRWLEVRVGQIVRVENKHEVPADIIVLATSEKQGMCYIETSNIDGETNLKIKEAVPGIARDAHAERSVGDVTGKVYFEQPNDSIHTFGGRLCLDGHDDKSVGVNNLILRGCTLRNTRWVLGLVVFTGAETKVMKKGSGGRSKMSRIEKIVNQCIFIVFGTQFVLCTVSTILERLWSRDNTNAAYLHLGELDYLLPTWLATWIAFFILYNNFIPISLYVTIEMVNFVQALLVDNDSSMYDAETST
jgi:hypothetical protein